MPKRSDHPGAGHSPAAEPWPEGVTARYLTVGGATVDITPALSTQPDTPPYELVAACAGCPDSKTVSTYRTEYNSDHPFGEEVHQPEQAEEDARKWAQDHAETCRALPRPGGAA